MCVPREQRPLLLLEHSRTIEDALDATERERDEARAALAKAEEDRGQWMRRHVACEKANDSLQAELAELRSLWACDEAERQRAVEAWCAETGSQGTPSVGGMLAFWRRERDRIREANFGLQRELAQLRDGFRLCVWVSLGMPWDGVPDHEITAYVERARNLKAHRDPCSCSVPSAKGETP